MIRIGIVGCGRWGPNHIRVFSAQAQSRVTIACDPSAERREAVSRHYPGLPVVAETDEVLHCPNVDAVVIATPVETHYDLVTRALAAGKDVLCEKPLCRATEQGEILTELAQRGGRVLMVGHVYLFNSAIEQIRKYVRAGTLGTVRYAYSMRCNRGPVRQDVNVLYDLASHDISIFDYVFDSHAEAVGGQGTSILRPGVEDVAFLWLRYPGDLLVQIHVSWLAARKARQLSICGDDQAVEWDELSGVGPVKLVEPAPADSLPFKNFGELQQLSRESGISVPRIPASEPLDAQAQHFLDCVRQRSTPLCDGMRGTRIVATLEKLQQALRPIATPS